MKLFVSLQFLNLRYLVGFLFQYTMLKKLVNIEVLMCSSFEGLGHLSVPTQN
jgi:hypothetical protein